MKRSYGIQRFIYWAFGMAQGCFLILDMESDSLFFTLVSIVIYVAFVLYVSHGYDKNDEK